MMNHKSVILFAFALSTILSFASCKAKEQTRTEFVFGTVCSINLYDAGTTEIQDEIFSRLRELESILSANRDDTNIAAINRAAGIAPVKAAPETFQILKKALLYRDKTDGAFDPTIGPLVKLWNIGTDSAAVPSPEAIKTAVSLVNGKKVKIDEVAGTVFLPEKGMRLDLGAIAKGYAADEAARIISNHGITRAMIDLGGNIYAMGEKATKKPWVIGIRDPEEARGQPILSLPVSNMSIVTSGVYERFFEENGVRYHHILDPKTGYPSNNGLVSVTIVTPVSINADALSTSTFLMGTEGGMRLVSEVPETDAIFINDKKEVRVTPRLRDKIRILDNRYILVDEDSARQ